MNGWVSRDIKISLMLNKKLWSKSKELSDRRVTTYNNRRNLSGGFIFKNYDVIGTISCIVKCIVEIFSFKPCKNYSNRWLTKINFTKYHQDLLFNYLFIGSFKFVVCWIYWWLRQHLSLLTLGTYILVTTSLK